MPKPTDFHIRSASLAGYLDLAASLGLNAQQMLRNAGIAPRSLARPDALLSVRAVRNLLEESARQSGVEDFGLRLAVSRRLSNLGPISLVLRDEPTARQLLTTLFRYMRLVNETLFTALEDAGETVVIREEFLLATEGSARQSMELAVGVMHRLLREVLGPGWEARSVCFAHRPPHDLAGHLRMFGRFVRFNADFNGIVCAAADLDRPLERADPAMARLALQYLDQLRSGSRQSASDKTRQIIIALLPSGRCTADTVAAHMGVNRRTLHRHLAKEGLTFNAILSGLRAELVTRHLADSDRTVVEIADLLGFASASAFARWFRQCFGSTSSVWRRQRAAPGAVRRGTPTRSR